MERRQDLRKGLLIGAIVCLIGCDQGSVPRFVESFIEQREVEEEFDKRYGAVVQAGQCEQAADESRFTIEEQAEIGRFLEEYKYLSEYGYDVNAITSPFGGMLLFEALLYGEAFSRGSDKYIAWDIAVVKFLVFEGADVNARNEGDDTPLHYATRWYRNIEIVKILVAKGANVNAKDQFGVTPLFWAVDDVEMVKFLISQGADVNVKAEEGITPLLFAMALANNIEVAKHLISAGADIHVRDEDGGSALHRATSNKIEFAKFLVSQGVDIDAKDNNGKTPLDWARQCKNAEVVEYLESIGAKSGSEIP